MWESYADLLCHPFSLASDGRESTLDQVWADPEPILSRHFAGIQPTLDQHLTDARRYRADIQLVLGRYGEDRNASYFLLLQREERREVARAGFYIWRKGVHGRLVTYLRTEFMGLCMAPIPGGCNMEFSIETSPFLRTSVGNSMIMVDAQPASSIGPNGNQLPCEKNFVTYETYRLYIPERDFTSETYFATMSRMLTVDNIIKFGKRVPPAVSTSQMRRVFSAYPGTGSVYAMIARYKNSSVAYVPAFSYACSPLSNPESCSLLNTTISKVICATILFVGFFLTFIGHVWFCAEMFFLGTISGGVVGHICLAAAEYEDISAQLGLSLLIGVLTGIASITLWCTFGMPCIAILQATLSLGALVASITYFSIPDGIALFENDANFWVVYAAIMIMVPLLLCMFPLSSNIVCCAFVGAYTIVLSIDYWLGSNLKYIVINTVRRMVVRGFNVATIQPPYQGEDIWLAVIWVMLALFGMSLQRKRLNGRPPFPSPANYTTIRSERSPLLSQVRNGRQVLVLRENDEVYRYSRCCWH
ncbi:transmembrane 7 superfamily member 3 isoform X3 [Diachasma alloeum]|uniref:transmembrane 7 superfamily member 3 isoform X3 n=1 Tax=Diachasma alloeum TaxID=454923 RepID=UPI0007383D57|nr:transmembrane 7 superfamily member 3 isoform X3 [Diachasma alloeum]